VQTHRGWAVKVLLEGEYVYVLDCTDLSNVSEVDPPVMHFATHSNAQLFIRTLTADTALTTFDECIAHVVPYPNPDNTEIGK